MAYLSNSNQYGVITAIGLVTELVLARRGTSGGTNAAIRTVARDCNISPAQVRRLFQPSRRPKQVGYDIWLRICRGYRGYIERELQRLESSRRILDTLDEYDPAARAKLAAEAENLARRIRQHL